MTKLKAHNRLLFIISVIVSNVRLGFCMHLKTVKKIKKSEFYA